MQITRKAMSREGKTAQAVAAEAARMGGDILRDYYRKGTYSVRTKADTSLQTAADLAAEQVIIERLRTAFPEHRLECEERGIVSERPSSSLWQIDALDGTENFVLGLPYFSSTVTLHEHGQPQVAVVYEPITGNLYTAVRGEGAWLNGERLHVSQTNQFKDCRAFLIPDFVTKRQSFTVSLRHELHLRCRRVLDTWSPALDWCLVASGKADLVVAIAGESIRPDAGTLILEEAGGRITDFSSQIFTGKGQRLLVGSNGTDLHTRILHLISCLKDISPTRSLCRDDD